MVPPHPATKPLEELDALSLLAATIYLEAEGEPDEGKLAVGFVIMTRSARWGKTVHDVILKPFQFSCHNPDYRMRAAARLLAAQGEPWEASWRAAASALWRLMPDPSSGADHYLNEALTRAGRKKLDLPAWFDESKVVARLGAHTFLNLG